jgi:hypothetical protein
VREGAASADRPRAIVLIGHVLSDCDQGWIFRPCSALPRGLCVCWIPHSFTAQSAEAHRNAHLAYVRGCAAGACETAIRLPCQAINSLRPGLAAVCCPVACLSSASHSTANHRPIRSTTRDRFASTHSRCRTVPMVPAVRLPTDAHGNWIPTAAPPLTPSPFSFHLRASWHAQTR